MQTNTNNDKDKDLMADGLARISTEANYPQIMYLRVIIGYFNTFWYPFFLDKGGSCSSGPVRLGWLKVSYALRSAVICDDGDEYKHGLGKSLSSNKNNE